MNTALKLGLVSLLAVGFLGCAESPRHAAVSKKSTTVGLYKPQEKVQGSIYRTETPDTWNVRGMSQPGERFSE